MSPAVRAAVRPGTWVDSVALLDLARALRGLPGVQEAAALMGTPANRDLLGDAGLLAGDAAAALRAAGPNDLMLAVRADDEPAAAAALARADGLLAERRAGGGGAAAAARPRALATALRRAPEASFALISVPGPFAAAEARKALARGLDVMLFSDNVALADEAELKRLALARGRLLLGPDCGTAYLGGAALGFANVVRPGRVGVIAASGTGLQQVACLLDAGGAGVAHAIGVGGRDLTAEIGGAMTLAAIDRLADDGTSAVLVVIGKPPDPGVRRAVEARLGAAGRPGVLCLLGPDVETGAHGTVETVATLEAAAVAALRLLGLAALPGASAETIARRAAEERAQLAAGQRAVRGLYAGGTLAQESALILGRALGPVGGNVGGAAGPAPGAVHQVVDLGADEYTRSRAHPMLDATLRAAEIARVAEDPALAVLLVDVVLGLGAADDPAGDLAPALHAARETARRAGRHLAMVATVIGTDADPQGRRGQIERLEAAGAWVLPSNAAAARAAAAIAGATPELRDVPAPGPRAGPAATAPRAASAAPRAAAAAKGPLARPRVVAIGVERFADDLDRAGDLAARVAWSLPAAGDARRAALLARLDDDADVARANEIALTRLVGAQPFLIDCRPASEALGLRGRVVLHAGPPLPWARACATVQAAVLCAVRYEGWAADDAQARVLVERGEVALEPCHHRGAAGPMTGIVTPSMPVLLVEDRAGGGRAAATINEGLGRVLRFGANDESVLARLRWLAEEAGPLLGAALRRSGGLDLRALMAQAVRMGDEMHQRNVAASSLLVRALLPHVARAAADGAAGEGSLGGHGAVARLAEFVSGNDQFFLNVAMAAAKACADPCLGIAGSTMVATMARNGTDFGIRVAGLGDRWFTAPVNLPRGLYFPGYAEADGNPDMGDSAIVETIGLGAFAMAAAPAVARFLGTGGAAEAFATTEEMREICLGDHPHFRVPALDDLGTPVGIDVRRVVETGIAPLINTGIAGRVPGTGQIGAGVVRAPLACFEAALDALGAARGAVAR